MAPVIGITRFDPSVDFVVAVQRAGGEPRIIDWRFEQVASVLPQLDGVILGSGDDVAPELYGATPHPATRLVPPEQDRFELELARLALDGDLPLLGICRGPQVLNVAAGGTLVQDIPSEVSAPLRHAVPTPLTAGAHEVWISRRSRLGTVLRGELGDAEGCMVNSRHHQSIALVGASLEVSAMAPDGVIEAVERPEAAFCVAVQWHPENYWRTGEFQSLFTELVTASRARHAARRVPPHAP